MKAEITLNSVKKDNIILFNKIMNLKNNIDDFNIFYNNMVKSNEFKINVMFTDRTSTQLKIYFKKITFDLNNLINENDVLTVTDSRELVLLNCLINDELFLLKHLLLKIKRKMMSSGNYLNITHNYYNSFPLTLFNDIEYIIMTLENKLNNLIMEVL